MIPDTNTYLYVCNKTYAWNITEMMNGSRSLHWLVCEDVLFRHIFWGWLWLFGVWMNWFCVSEYASLAQSSLRSLKWGFKVFATPSPDFYIHAKQLFKPVGFLKLWVLSKTETAGRSVRQIQMRTHAQMGTLQLCGA